jgi:hypothetical protein
MVIVTHFPHTKDSPVTPFLRQRLAAYDCRWVKDGRAVLISGEIDVDKLFEELKAVVHVWDTLLIATVSQPIAVQGLEADALAEWIDEHSC